MTTISNNQARLDQIRPTLMEKQVSLEQMMPIFAERLAAGGRVTFGPKGTSMRPMLRQGIDRVEITAVKGPLKKYDLPLYQRSDGQYVLHRIVKAGKTYTCIGDNQFILEPGVKEEQLLAVATGFYRGDRYIPFTSVRYKIYCRYWHYSRPLRKLLRPIKGKLMDVARKLKGKWCA